MSRTLLEGGSTGLPGINPGTYEECYRTLPQPRS